MAEVTRTCRVCGELFRTTVPNKKYCCEECKRLGSEQYHKQRNEKRKAKRHMQNALNHKENGLDKRLREAKEKGLTYAELQVQKTLEGVRKGEL